MMKRSVLCLGMIIVCCLVISNSASVHTGNETDKLSLLEFKANINGDPLGLLRSWNESVHFCSWPGITCSRRHRQRVTALNLPSWQLSGQLSPHVGNLSFLRVLRLTNNCFDLKIPQEIGRLFRLRVLSLGNNSFSGKIPRNISGCSGLRFLFMLRNNLTGRVPDEIGSLLELRTVSFSLNNLGGQIPDSMGNLSSLVELYLLDCGLQGTIPASLGRLKSLTTLVLQFNYLTGIIPLSLYNVSTIEMFGLGYNILKGNLPRDLGLTLPNLQFFSVDQNSISGSIPPSVSNLSNLETFQIVDNKFTGKIPSFASNFNLKHLYLSINNLGSAENGDLTFLRDLVNCTNLERLGIGYNNLRGSIPETISNMTSLKQLIFGMNWISGEIPNGIGNLVNLEVLVLEVNQLTGHIPSTIGKLRNMTVLQFDNNNFSGTIPSTLNNLTLLDVLSFSGNKLEGKIPKSLGECMGLRELSLASNNLSGPIPVELFSLSSLTLTLDLSRNQLTGAIPLQVGNLVNLGVLYFSENKLAGEIPKSISHLTSMETLYLQGNFLQGPIPAEVNSLRGIRVIDFSRNNLSGRLPMYFEDFRGLQYLNFSFNKFEGQVPIRGVFKNASQFSITGNTRLCGGLPELKLPECPSNLYEDKRLPTRTKLIISVACAITGLMVIMFLVTFVVRSQQQSKSSLVKSSIGISLPRVSYEDLSKATDSFSSLNLIGIGSFGSVYKGILDPEERLVAVKVLNLDISHALKSFLIECESLRSIRHRNIVKLLTVCSSIDFIGNDFKALVYEFMENGNLEEWLHSESRGHEQNRFLNLMQRVIIAIDVACALDYLHNHVSESIAHRDIKPSNILLNGQMAGHVGDFGLAKLIRSACCSSSNNQSSSIGVRGTIGYIPPEYVMGSEASTLGDIYSYGILLLEIFTGKRPTDSMFKDDFNLHSFASMALQGRISEIVDPRLLEEENRIRGSGDEAQVEKCLISIIEIGVVCASTFPRERRNMGDVVAELSQIRDMLNGYRVVRNRATMHMD